MIKLIHAVNPSELNYFWLVVKHKIVLANEDAFVGKATGAWRTLQEAASLRGEEVEKRLIKETNNFPDGRGRDVECTEDRMSIIANGRVYGNVGELLMPDRGLICRSCTFNLKRTWEIGRIRRNWSERWIFLQLRLAWIGFVLWVLG